MSRVTEVALQLAATKWIDYVTKKVNKCKKHRSESEDESATEVAET